RHTRWPRDWSSDVCSSDLVELARAPTVEDAAHRRLIDAQQIGEWLQVGCQRDDLAHIQIAVGPAIQTVADPGRHAVIDSGVAEEIGRASCRARVEGVERGG